MFKTFIMTLGVKAVQIQQKYHLINTNKSVVDVQNSPSFPKLSNKIKCYNYLTSFFFFIYIFAHTSLGLMNMYRILLILYLSSAVIKS